jgi:hypothetical protein
LILSSDFFEEGFQFIAYRDLSCLVRLGLFEVNETIPDLVPFQTQDLPASHGGEKRTGHDS